MSRSAIIKTFVILGLIGGAYLVYSLWRHGLPLWGAYLVGIGVLTFLAYGFDKLQAQAQRTRVPEVVLHLVTLAGGTPGALLGQKLFRHKTQKQSFRRIFWAIVAIQLLGLGAAYYVYLR